MSSPASMANNPVTRVMIWSTPRSTSTALLRSLTNIPNSQMWCEPFLYVNYCGQDGTYRDIWMKWLMETRAGQDLPAEISKIKVGFRAHDVSFSWVKDQLEASPPPNVNVIVCKDQPQCFINHYEHIPCGLKHTFLIRHPYKVLTSWKKMINRGNNDMNKHMKLTDQHLMVFPKGYHVKELHDMWQHVKANIEPYPVIIDADELSNDPGTVLKAYCDAIGVPYSDNLLSWEPGNQCVDEGIWMTPKEMIATDLVGKFHVETFSSSSFVKPSPCPKKDDLDPDVLQCSDAVMKYYQEMYENRIKC